MVSSEAHPFAKTGGLAEVVGALPPALARHGHEVTLVLPRYRGIDTAGAVTRDAALTLGGRDVRVTYHELQMTDRITAVLVDVPELFDREGLYGDSTGDYPDNAWRFGVFSRAAVEYPRLRGTRPSIIHAHDWQTGLVPVYQKTLLAGDPTVGGTPVVFTIHNLAFQGLFPAATLPSLDLGWDLYNLDALEYWGKISLLKGGINFSDKITTVSPRYATEILGSDLGFGFDGVLSRRATDLVGILNGIDVERWNPSSDPFIAASFTVGDLSGKRADKRALLETVGLAVNDTTMARPLVGLISRLTDQKGFDLLMRASADLMAVDASWVMLGSGERRYEEQWRDLAQRYPDRLVATIGFDEQLAHRIEAGADLFLMPSRFEPCGLNQLYSLRYGTVPVVRAVGGLDDTVVDADEHPEGGNGFKFGAYTPAALLDALQRAVSAFHNPSRWRQIQQTGMRQDHSWDASAAEYVKVYRASRRARA
jgi:starch synthase